MGDETAVIGIGKLAEALSKAQGEMKAAPKSKINPFFKSKYADLDACWEVCRTPLSKNGLAIAQFATSNGNTVTVTTMLMHSSGESIKSDLSLTAKDSTPQSIGSAITYGRRYGLSAMVGISPEDDDDANTAQPAGKIELISQEQLSQLCDLIDNNKVNKPKFLAFVKLEKLEDMIKPDFQKNLIALQNIIKAGKP